MSTISKTHIAPNAALWASATPAIREAWQTWQSHADAWQDAHGRSDTVMAESEWRRADAAARLLMAIQSNNLDDVAVKTYVVAWARCHRGDDDLIAVIEETLAAETLALQPPILLD